MKYSFLINGLLTGGAEKFVLTITDYLKDNTEIELICLQREININKLPDIPIHFLSNANGSESGLFKLVSLPLLAFRLKKLLIKRKINVVQSHLFRADYVNMLATIFGSKHNSQIFVHGDPAHYKKEGLLGKINLLLIKIFYPRADKIITNTNGMAKSIAEIAHLHLYPVIFPNLFNIDYIRYLADNMENVTHFSKPYIVTVGRLFSLKRHRDIIKAFKIITAKQKNVDLVIIGDGPERKNLEYLIKENNLTNKIHFLGKKDNPFPYIKKALVSILASESESFGNVLIESMCLGTPVIAADCQYGPHEILNENNERNSQFLKNGYKKTNYGILFAVGDYKALADALLQIFNDKSLTQNYIKISLERSKQYDIRKLNKVGNNLFG